MFFPKTEREHVGFPTKEAEALLDVFEYRIPNMKRLILQQDALISAQDAQIGVLEESLTLTASNAADYKRVADAYKEAALAQANATFWEEVWSFFSDKLLWFGGGILVGVATYAVIDKVAGDSP